VVKKLNSERFVRNPVLLAQLQTFELHQILRYVSSSEFILDLFEIITQIQEREGIHLKVRTEQSTEVQTWDLHF
jgi:hypothetical protein